MNIVVHNERKRPPPLIPFGAEDALNARRPRGSVPPPCASVPGPVFDHWLNQQLGRLYDPVAEEPIPPELLRLLEIRLK